MAPAEADQQMDTMNIDFGGDLSGMPARESPFMGSQTRKLTFEVRAPAPRITTTQCLCPDEPAEDVDVMNMTLPPEFRAAARAAAFASAASTPTPAPTSAPRPQRQPTDNAAAPRPQGRPAAIAAPAAPATPVASASAGRQRRPAAIAALAAVAAIAALGPPPALDSAARPQRRPAALAAPATPAPRAARAARAARTPPTDGQRSASKAHFYDLRNKGIWRVGDTMVVPLYTNDQKTLQQGEARLVVSFSPFVFLSDNPFSKELCSCSFIFTLKLS